MSLKRIEPPELIVSAASVEIAATARRKACGESQYLRVVGQGGRVIRGDGAARTLLYQAP